MHRAQKLLWSAIFNIFIVAAEVVGGIISRSVALLSDALHNSGDVLSILFSYWGAKIAERPEDERFTYGYKRAEIVSAMVVSTFVIIVGSFIFFEGVKKLLNPEQIGLSVMLPVAVVGLIGNLLTLLFLHSHAHESLSVRATLVHIMGDTFSSVAIVVVGIIFIFKDWYFLDGLISIVISLYLIFMSIPNLRDSAKILMQAVPEGWTIEDVVSGLQRIEGVRDVHHVHIWTPDGKEVYVELHVVKEDSSNVDDVLRSVHRKLESMGISHATVQIEESSCPEKDGGFHG